MCLIFEGLLEVVFMALPIRNTLPGQPQHAGSEGKAQIPTLFPGGFYNQKYIDWERGYKWAVHQAWDHTLNHEEYRRLLRGHEFQKIADLAVALEARTHLLKSLELNMITTC